MKDEDIVESIHRLASAITPNIVGNKDDAGGHVESLTEAVMGVTAGLCKIADAIEHLAEAVEESNQGDKIAQAINNHAEAVLTK